MPGPRKPLDDGFDAIQDAVYGADEPEGEGLFD